MEQNNPIKPERRHERPLRPKPPEIPQTLHGQIMSIQHLLNTTTDTSTAATLKKELATLLISAIRSRPLTEEQAEVASKLEEEFFKVKYAQVRQAYDSNDHLYKYFVGSSKTEVAAIPKPSEINGITVARRIADEEYLHAIEPTVSKLYALAIEVKLLEWKGGIKHLPMAEKFRERLSGFEVEKEDKEVVK
ncbi:MAG: hypothetical protein J7L32_05270 [Thermoplasmata archaeon]|nr:hypothetical protein [Thermoplasmata archaeon]